MSKEFLSRENTSTIYKEILKRNNLQALPKKTKEIIVNTLISNMKTVFKKIDVKRVNRDNFGDLLEQFNNVCVNETTKSLKNSDIFTGEDTQVSRLKFARDFNSTPRKEVQFLDRPSNQQKTNNFSNNSMQNIDKQIRGSSNSLDSMFQPIGEVNDSSFGYMNQRDESADINKQMD